MTVSMRLVVSSVDTAILALVSFCKLPETLLSVISAKPGVSSTLETAAGTLATKRSICDHIAGLDTNHALLGSTPEERAMVSQWTTLCATHIDPAAMHKQSPAGLKLLLDVNSHLENRTHLVANRITLADIMVSCAVHPILSGLNFPDQPKVGNVSSWYDRIQSETSSNLPVLKFKTEEECVAEMEAALAAASVKKEKGSKSPKPARAAEVPEVSQLDIRVGKIMSVEKHPDADSLYVEKIDVGDGGGAVRTICSGLVKYTTEDKLRDRMVLVLCNMKPVNMRGIKSEGMLLAASDAEKTVVEPLDPPQGAKPGDHVILEGYPRQPVEQLNPKKKVFEKVQPDLKTDANGLAIYKGTPLTVNGIAITAVIPNGNIS